MKTKKNRTALELYVETRPQIITPVVEDPSEKLTDTDAAVGALAGGSAAALLRLRGTPFGPCFHIGKLLAKSFSHSGLGSRINAINQGNGII